MAIGNFFVMIGTNFTSYSSSPSFFFTLLSALGILIFLLGFELGPGPVFSLVVAELYPPAERARALSAFVSMNWAANVSLVLLFPSLLQLFGQANVFALFCILCMCVVYFLYLRLPETKDQSIQQIQAALASSKLIRSSSPTSTE